MHADRTSDRLRRRVLHARWIFPIDQPPIADGVLVLEGPRIAAVGRRGDAIADAADERIDLGNVAVVPGFINAHTHLEFSNLTAPLGSPGMGFIAWIEAVLQYRRENTEPKRKAVRRGLRELVAAGTTVVGEITQPGGDDAVLCEAPLEAVSFLELLAPTVAREADARAAALTHLIAADERGAECALRVGLCPHAPTTVRPELLAWAAELSAERRIPLAFHLAESREEMQWLHSETGPFHEFLGRIEGGWRRPNLRNQGVMDYLHLLAEADRALIIHGNYLDEEAQRFAAARSERMSVVYCPRTHAYFGHSPYPLAEMLAYGVMVAVGTDGRASAPDLSVLNELRFLAARGGVPPATILAMGTLHGAKALGRHSACGSLTPGKFADLAILALPDRETRDPHELLFDSDRPVAGRWFRGTADPTTPPPEPPDDAPAQCLIRPQGAFRSPE